MTVKAGFFKASEAVRTCLPSGLYALTAAGTSRFFFDFLQKGFFFERALIGLAYRTRSELGKCRDQIEPVLIALRLHRLNETIDQRPTEQLAAR